MPVDVDRVIGWLNKADQIFKTPLVRMTVFPLLSGLIPDDELSEKDLQQVRDHFADLDKRGDRAKERAGRQL